MRAYLTKNSFIRSLSISSYVRVGTCNVIHSWSENGTFVILHFQTGERIWNQLIKQINHVLRDEVTFYPVSKQGLNDSQQDISVTLNSGKMLVIYLDRF